MDFSRLEQAPDYEVEEWLKKNLELTAYGKEQIYKNEIVRFCPYKFYKKKQIKKRNFFWRLTSPVFIVYCCLIMIGIPVKWLIFGNRYLPQKFLENFHYRWIEKMGW